VINEFWRFELNAGVSVLDLWLKGCEINETKIYPLEGQGKTALYKVWKDFIGADYHEYHTTPVFIGWVDGKQVCATTNYKSALACWRNHVKEGDRNGKRK
jgi:hypothetical protein